jgi:hypothetical protein
MMTHMPAGDELDRLMHSRIFLSKDKVVPRYSADWSEVSALIEEQLAALGCEVKHQRQAPSKTFNRMQKVVVSHKMSGKTCSALAPTMTLALCRASVQLSYKVQFGACSYRLFLSVF